MSTPNDNAEAVQAALAWADYEYSFDVDSLISYQRKRLPSGFNENNNQVVCRLLAGEVRRLEQRVAEAEGREDHWRSLLGRPANIGEAIARLLDQRESAEAALAAFKFAVVATVGGTVEGNPTHEGNYLQRLRELVKAEAARISEQIALAALEESLRAAQAENETSRKFWEDGLRCSLRDKDQQLAAAQKRIGELEAADRDHLAATNGMRTRLTEQLAANERELIDARRKLEALGSAQSLALGAKDAALLELLSVITLPEVVSQSEVDAYKAAITKAEAALAPPQPPLTDHKGQPMTYWGGAAQTEEAT
jgi:DNA repair exonuclease SbcCD ATPase subunit